METNSNTSFEARLERNFTPPVSLSEQEEFALKTVMQSDIVHFAFQKQDGTLRVAFGTLCQSLIDSLCHNAGKKQGTRTPGYNTFVYFDVEKEEWRSFVKSNFMAIDKEYNPELDDFTMPQVQQSGASRYYFFHTVKEGARERLKPLPNQFEDDGTPIDVKFNTSVATGDKKLREAYPIGTVFCSMQCLSNGSYYNAGNIYPILKGGSVSYNPSLRMPDQQMLRAYDAYLAGKTSSSKVLSVLMQ